MVYLQSKMQMFSAFIKPIQVLVKLYPRKLQNNIQNQDKNEIQNQAISRFRVTGSKTIKIINRI